MKLHAEILEKDGHKQFAILPYEEFLALQERVADAEDVLELRKARKAEGCKRSVPLAEVKRRFGIKQAPTHRRDRLTRLCTIGRSTVHG